MITGLSPAFYKRGETWVSVGPLESFEIGKIRQAEVEVPTEGWQEGPGPKAVYVWRRSAEELVVYSRNCTDLSCPVIWDPASERFFCPCHGGIFAKDGTPVAGPPPRPLMRYTVRLRDDTIQIDLASLPPVT